MENVIEVRYAGVVVGRSTKVRDWGASGAFIGFAEPLPTGTSLVLRGDGIDQPARVVEVIESADPAVAGMQVTFVGAAEAPRPAQRAGGGCSQTGAGRRARPYVRRASAPACGSPRPRRSRFGGASSAAVTGETSGPASGEHGEGQGDAGQPGQGGGKRRRRRR